MSNNTETQKTTFWNFLENHTLEIPIIQRDYAQGRKGKEELRKTFLGNLKDALDNNSTLTLDFVYGSKENNCFNPLDGQQRLTTLWLLHWYVAYKAGKQADKVVSDRFKKFTYETRVSSREFCEHLAEFNTPKGDFEGTISDFIQQQTWFYSAWKQDPTIQSMLRMLSGTPNKDKNGQEIVDGLEELFANTTEDQFKNYWKVLSGENCPISFYNLDLGELKLTDDLYIKMNARGEQLTSFENFKADLIGYIREQQKEAEDTAKEQWEKLLSPTDGVPIKMDTTWTDIFWKNNVDGKIDDIYFAFLNRFFLNEFICKKKEENSDYDKTVVEIGKDNTFKLLYGNESDDSKVTYQSFEKYKACITYTALQSLNATLDNFATFEGGSELFQPNWSNGKIDYYFIPKYKDEIITTLTQLQRVVFYAICKYFEKENDDGNKKEENSFKHWMRVVWNLVENDSAGWIGCLRLIDELSEHSHDIYTFLAEKCSITEGKINGITSQANSSQVKEEIEKAKKILSDNSWEVKIKEAENYAFFKGSIRFLFRNEKGEFDWSNFETKWKNAQKYFDKNGAKDKTTPAEILRNFISHFDNWGQFWEFSFDNSDATWKTLLTNSKWAAPIHQLLTQELIDFSNYNTRFTEKIKQQVQEDLVKTNLLDKIIDKKCVLNWRNDCYVLYPSNAKADYKKFVIANPRNAILSACYEKVEKGKHLSNGKITTDQKIDGCDFFWGWDIKFRYKKDKDKKSYHFEWNTDGNIYLMDNEWNYTKTDNDYVKIDTNQIIKDNLLEQQLNNLISLNNPSQSDIEKTEM